METESPIQSWARRHAQTLVTLPEDLRLDTMQIAAVLIGPMMLARMYGADVHTPKTLPWTDLLNPDLAELVGFLAHVGLEARVPCQSRDRSAPADAFVAQCVPVIMPATEQGAAMYRAAAAIAIAELEHIFAPDEPDDEAPPEPQDPPETAPETAPAEADPEPKNNDGTP